MQTGTRIPVEAAKFFEIDTGQPLLELIDFFDDFLCPYTMACKQNFIVTTIITETTAPSTTMTS